ncbi:MAG: PEP-CTERM sorting domain-containing protein [Pseudomonadota bacterium]
MNSNGNATGFSNVLIEGFSYDVALERGTFDEVFGTGNPPSDAPFFLDDAAGAEAAALALAMELAATNATRVEAEEGTVRRVFDIPVSVGGRWGGAAVSHDGIPLGWRTGNTSGTPRSFETTFATFTTVASVPEPGTTGLFVLGALVIALRGGKSRARETSWHRRPQED